jgi:Insertion element 4 transposase N-terminal/Transposase DDE domain
MGWGWLSPRGRVLSRAGAGVLSWFIPADLVDEAVGDGLAWEMRLRSLPARLTVYFVLGCALLPDKPYAEVMRRVTAGLRGALAAAGWAVPATTALSSARARLGEKPLESLFRRLCPALSPGRSPWSHAGGLLVVAWDGTTVAAYPSPGNAAAFGRPGTGAEQGRAVNPQLRLVALLACGTRGLLDAVTGPVRGAGTGEQSLARGLLRSLHAGMLLLADRNFYGYQLWNAAAGTGADLLWRVKAGTHLPVVAELPDGSWLAHVNDPAAVRRRTVRNGTRRRRGSKLPPGTGPLPGITVRVIEFWLTVAAADGAARTERYRLITTLADHRAWPAGRLAACYAWRWAIEMVFTQLAKRAMRPVGGGREHVADLGLVVGDDDPVDEQFGQLPPLLEAGGGQPGPDGLAECLDAVGDGLEFEPLPGSSVQLVLLGEQRGVPPVQVLAFALGFGQPEDLGEVGVQEPLLLALELAQGLAEGRLPGLELLGQPGPALGPGQRAGDLGRVGQQRAQVGPDQLIELPGGDVTGGAAPPLRRAQRVGAPAAQVVAVAGSGLAAGARQPARAAADQRAQQVLVPGIAGRALLVGIQLGLHLGEGLLAHDRRDRHLDPVLFRPRGKALAPAGRQERRPAPAGRRHLSAVGQCAA